MNAGRGISGYLLLLAIGVCWGFNWPAVKIVLGELPPFTLRSIGLAAGGTLLLLIARASGHALNVPREQRAALVVAGLLGVAGFNLLTAFGQLLMPTSKAAILAFTMPAWASLLAVFVLGEPLTKSRVLALALGLGGLALLLGPDLRRIADPSFGAAYMLGAAISWAAGTVLVKRLKWSTSTVVLAGWQVLVSAVPAIVGMILFEARSTPGGLSAGAWLALGFHILLPMTFCHYAWFTVVGRFPAPVAAIGTLLIPVVGVLGSVWLLDERIGWREPIALLAILGSVAAALLGDARARRGGERARL